MTQNQAALDAQQLRIHEQASRAVTDALRQPFEDVVSVMYAKALAGAFLSTVGDEPTDGELYQAAVDALHE